MRVDRGVSRFAGLLALSVPLFLAGCDECWDDDCCHGWGGDDEAPSVPVGLTSVTGDGEVHLEWYDVQDRDLAGYRVYVSDRLSGPYESIGETSRNHFLDSGARNGSTYYYAVAAFDHCDNESDLSYETVFDTPRPEGYDLVLFSTASVPGEAGYDFSAFRRQAWNALGTDVYFQINSGVPYMYAATSSVGIQDLGFMRMDELDWAPDRGWSEQGRVEVIEGHTYAVLTADDHYAKFYVDSISGDRVSIDWAYQIDRGNRELSIETPVTSTGSGTGTTPSGGKTVPEGSR